MRVLMPILEYHPIPGGAQRQLAAIAPLLRERGVELHVVTRRAPGLAAFEVVDEVPVHRLWAPGPKALASLVFSAAALAKIRALEPDLVHAYSLFSPTTLAVAAHRWLGVPTVVKVLRGGHLGDVERLRAKPFAHARIARMREGIDRFLCLGSEIEHELLALGVAPTRCVRLPNGVDTDRYRPASDSDRREARHRIGAGDGPQVVYCGRLVPEKRVDLLLEAWRTVHAAVPEARLVVVGDGPEAASLRANAPERVHFAGAVHDVIPFLQAADLFVLPSATEGLSNALLEAMACGLPVVATRVGAAEELVADGEHGRLVPANDAPALARALCAVLTSPERARQGARARAHVEKHYALPGIADRLQALYVSLLEGREAHA